MKYKLKCNLHIMWYEAKMLCETLSSIMDALENAIDIFDISFKICINNQTYLETPIEGRPEDMIQYFSNHDFFRSVNVIKDAVIFKNNNSSFYNIGDWRRDCYRLDNEDPNTKYSIWLESDCLLPKDYFYILQSLNIDTPHIVSFASRKMWDDTWKEVEFSRLKEKSSDKIEFPFSCGHQIDQKLLNAANDAHTEEFPEYNIEPIRIVKIDGSLLSLSPGLPKFIPEDLHFVREDFCAQQVFNKHNIPQYHVDILKGHNYNHTKKRTNTLATRDDSIFKQYAEESINAMNKFLQQ